MARRTGAANLAGAIGIVGIASNSISNGPIRPNAYWVLPVVASSSREWPGSSIHETPWSATSFEIGPPRSRDDGDRVTP